MIPGSKTLFVFPIVDLLMDFLFSRSSWLAVFVGSRRSHIAPGTPTSAVYLTLFAVQLSARTVVATESITACAPRHAPHKPDCPKRLRACCPQESSLSRCLRARL